MQVTVPAPAGELTGYLSVPVTAGPWPGVVVIHEALGLTDDMRQQADRLAAAGYLALAPDLFSWGPSFRCMIASMRSLSTGHGRAFDDIEAARLLLAGRPDCTGRIGVIGFCMGGGFALLTAAKSDFQASAPNYGMLPKHPEQALAGSCATVASYGARDKMIPRGSAAKLEQALTALGVEHDVKEYPTVGHSFHTRYNAGPIVPIARAAGVGYDHDVSQDSWQRVLTFFDAHLKA